MMTPGGYDLRKFQRAPFRRPVRYKQMNAGVFGGHLAQDISVGGMRLNSNEFVPVGVRVVLQVQFEAQGRLLDMEAKVVWTRELPQMNGFQLGLEFVEGNVFERSTLAQSMSKLIREG